LYKKLRVAELGERESSAKIRREKGNVEEHKEKPWGRK